MLISTATNHMVDTESGLFEEVTDEQAQSTSGGDFNAGNFSGSLLGGNPSVPNISINSSGSYVVNYAGVYSGSNANQPGTSAIYIPSISLTQGAAAPSGQVIYTLYTSGTFTTGGVLPLF